MDIPVGERCVYFILYKVLPDLFRYYRGPVPAAGTTNAYSEIASAFLFVKRDDMVEKRIQFIKETPGVLLGQNKFSHIRGCSGEGFEFRYKIGFGKNRTSNSRSASFGTPYL